MKSKTWSLKMEMRKKWEFTSKIRRTWKKTKKKVNDRCNAKLTLAKNVSAFELCMVCAGARWTVARSWRWVRRKVRLNDAPLGNSPVYSIINDSFMSTDFFVSPGPSSHGLILHPVVLRHRSTYHRLGPSICHAIS